MKRVWRRFLRGARDLYEACRQLVLTTLVVLGLALGASLALGDWIYAATALAMLVILAVLAYVEAAPEPERDYSAAFTPMQAETDRQIALASEKIEQLRQLQLRAMAARAAFGPTHDGREL